MGVQGKQFENLKNYPKHLVQSEGEFLCSDFHWFGMSLIAIQLQ